MPGKKAAKPGAEKSPQSYQTSAGSNPKLRALENAFSIVNQLKKDNIQAGDLRSVLNKMGVNLKDQEFQEVLLKTGVAKDGTVNFNSFIAALSKIQRFTELTVLKDAVQAVDRIERDKVLVSELPSFVRKMGIQLSDQEIQQALKKVSVDGNGKVVVKDFVKVLTNVPHFSDVLVLKNTIKALSCIQEDKISLQDLKPTLTKMGIHLTPLEYEEIIQTTPTDREGKLDLGQVMNKISKTQRFIDMEVLNDSLKAFRQFKDDKVKLSDVRACLNNIGIHFTEKELAEVTKSLHFSPEGTIDVKELMSAMKGAKRYANCVAVHDTIRALKLVKECKEMKSRQRKATLNTLGLRMANQVVSHVLKSAHVTDAGQAKFNDFMRTLTRNPKFKTSSDLVDAFAILKRLKNGRIGVEDLKVVMRSFNINISPEEISEALAFCTIDDNKTVNLKEFIKGVTHTSTFLISPDLQLTCLVLSKLKDEHFDLPALEATLDNMDLPEAKELLQEVMKMATVDQHGKVNFKEFIRIFLLLPEVPQEPVLKDTFSAMSVIKDNRVHVNDLAKTLANLDIHLTSQEIQELRSSVPASEDGMVNFKDVVTKLTGTQSFAEFKAVQDTFSAINRICKEKIKKEDLPAALEDVGICLSPDELQAILASVSVDESGMLEGTEFLKILADAPRFTEFVALQDAIKVVENIKHKNMTLAQLKQTLENMGVHLAKPAFDALVRKAKVDENGEINFKDFLLALGETSEFTELEALQRAIIMIGATRGSRMQLNELESTLDNLGVHLNQEEFQQAARNIQMAADGTVNVKDFLMSLAQMQRFSDSKALRSATEAFNRIKGEKVEVSELKPITESLGISLSNAEYEKALKRLTIDKNGKVNFKDFLTSVMENECFSELSAIHQAYGVLNKVEDDKIEISELEDVLNAIDITLTNEEMREALDYVTVDDDGKVNMKKFMSALPNTQRFSEVAEMEGVMKAVKRIQQDKVNVEELNTVMGMMGIDISPSEVQQALKYVTENDDGTVDLKNFMFGLTKIQHLPQAEKGRVAVEKLDSVLESMGLSLTKEEMDQALKSITVDENGKVNLNAFMKTVKSMKQLARTAGAPGSLVAVEEVNSLISNMGIHLSKEQLEEALKHVKVDENGKVNMNELMNYVLLTRAESQAEKDRVHVSNLDAFLINKGIYLTDDEIQEALRYAVVDEDGNVNLNEFIKGVKIVQRSADAEGKMVAAADLGSALAKMGIHLTEEEMKGVLKHMTLDAEGNVNLKSVLETVMATRSPSMFEKDRIAVQDLEGILASAGIYLTAEELQEALKYAPVDAEGKVNLGEFMKRVKAVQPHPRTGKMVAAADLGSTLAKMGIHLTEEEMKGVLKHLTLDAEGKVNLKSVLESVMATRSPSTFEKDRIAVQDLEGILASAGIYLTAEELQEALKYAPVDADGKVNLGEFMKRVKAVQPHPRTTEGKGEFKKGGRAVQPHPRTAEGKGNLGEFKKGVTAVQPHPRTVEGKVKGEVMKGVKPVQPHPRTVEGKGNLGEFKKGARAVQPHPRTGEMVAAADLGSTLAKMGIHLTEEEMKEVLKHITLDEEGKVNLKSVMETVMATQSPSMFENSKIAAQDLEGILASAGIYLTEEELQEALKYAPVDAEGKVNLGGFMKGVRAVQPHLRTGEMVAAADLSSTLAKMGIHLTEEEMKGVLKHMTLDAEGKVNLKSVLETVMATRSPSMFEKDRIAVQDLEGILVSAGIYLTAEELQEALKYAPVDAEGKVNLGEFMQRVRAVQPHPRTVEGKVKGEFMKGTRAFQPHGRTAEEAMDSSHLKAVKQDFLQLRPKKKDGWMKDARVDVDSLDAVLAEMGIHLTNKQLYDALKYAPIDADGKVNLEAFKRGVTAVLKAENRVEVCELESILADIGIHLTRDEVQRVLKLVTVNEDGTVNLKDFLWASQTIPSIQNKKVTISNLNSTLAALGIYLTPEELDEALKLTKHNEDGTVNLDNFIRACNATLTLPSTRTRYLSQMPDAKTLKLPKVMEKHHFQNAGRVSSSAFSSEKTKFGAAKILSNPQLEAFHKAYDNFCKDINDKIDLPALEATAHNLGISLSEEEAFEELVYADTDGDGRVNFTDFLNIVTDSKLFVQAVAPKKGSMETVDARGILFFELLSKLVETSALPKKTTTGIVSYYRQKFLESTGKKAWHTDEKRGHRGRKGSPEQKNESSSLAAFAGAGRIVVMKDKELESFVRSLQETTRYSDSPYAQVPVFPLIPNRDCVMAGKPKKDIQKMEAQRRMEPISSFEDHFFCKRRLLPPEKIKPTKTQRPSLTLAPELTSRSRRLTINNLDEIRREVKKATDNYRKAVALRERNKSLKLWRRVRGSEIGLETENPSFYQTFSTYSWSWNICQELLTPRELQEYDNRLYHSLSRSASPMDNKTRVCGKQKGSKK